MRKFISLLLALILVLSAFSIPVFAEATEPEDKAEAGITVTRISNPDGKPGDIDGLLGDRGTSYAWRLAKRGDDIYIATYRNLLSGVIDLFEEALAGEGISPEIVWGLSDVITNGELPEAQDTDGAYIIKYNTKTGEFSKVFTFPYLMQCRMVVNYEGDIYAGSFSSVLPRQYLYKIDENDNVTEVFSTSNSFSIRANCVYDSGSGDHLYFAGADEREVLADGDEDHVRVAVWEKDADDDTVWNRVADYKDFYAYTADEAMKNNTGCPVWELASHGGYIYAGMPYSKGFIIFRGRPAKDGEDANEYGWIWEEVVGKNNGINFPGMADDPEGHEDGNFSTIVSVYEFNGELYCFDFDQTIMAELAFIQGALYKVAGQEVTLSDMVRPVYNTLHHTQGLWKLNDKTGEFELCEGFAELMEGTTNEYVWRAQEHNGYMYVSTMDSAVIYNYITKLTNGSLTKMSKDELLRQITYVGKLIELIKPMVEDAVAEKLIAALEKYEAMLDELCDMEISDEEIQAYLDEYETLKAELDALMDEFIAEMEKELDEAFAELMKDSGEDEPYEDDIEPRGNLAPVGIEDGSIPVTYTDIIGAFKYLFDENKAEILEKIAQIADLFDSLNEDDGSIPVTYTDIIGAIKDLLADKKDEAALKLAQIEEQIKAALSAVKQKIDDTIESIDWEGMSMYLWVSETVENDAWGFDIVRTKDGVNFEVVTDDGFGDKYNYGCPAFLSTEEGLYIGTSNPFYGGQLYLLDDGTKRETETVKVSGKVTSFINDEETVTINLTDADEASVTFEAVGNDADYEFTDVAPGEYTLTVEKKDHTTRVYTLTVGEEDVEQDLYICPIGDVTLNGDVTAMDYARANGHVKGTRLITDEYALACGDAVGGDGDITTLDVSRISAHAKGTRLLWQYKD